MRAGDLTAHPIIAPISLEAASCYRGNLRAGGCHDKTFTWRHSYTEPTIYCPKNFSSGIPEIPYVSYSL